MKNRMLNFSGVSLSVSFDREKAEPIVENISKGCLNESYTPDPDELINSLVYMSECDKSHFIDKIDTSLTGEYIKEQEHIIDEEILEDYKELQNIMRLMYAYEALQSGDTDLIKSAMKKILYYFNSEFQRDDSEKLLNDYLDNMTEDEMKKYLQDFLANNIETSTFLSGIILAKQEEEKNKKKSYYGGGGYAAAVPTVKAITNSEQEKPATPENVKPVENQNKEEVLKSENEKKKEAETNKTTDKEKIKDDFLNSSTDSKKTKKDPVTKTIDNIKNTITSGNGKTLSNSVGGAAEAGIEAVKDLIANSGKVKQAIDGKLSSSVTAIANRGMEKIKPLVANVTENVGNSSAVIPGLAGLSTAAVAGVGTKVYIDKKDNKKSEEKTTKFFTNIEEEPEEKEEKNENDEEEIISKEDLVSSLENKF